MYKVTYILNELSSQEKKNTYLCNILMDDYSMKEEKISKVNNK